jgi:hypothetical protein
MPPLPRIFTLILHFTEGSVFTFTNCGRLSGSVAIAEASAAWSKPRN